MSNKVFGTIVAWCTAICFICITAGLALITLGLFCSTFSSSRIPDNTIKECKQQGFIQDQHTRINCTVVAE